MTDGKKEYEPEWYESLLMLVCASGGWFLRAWVATTAWAWFAVPRGANPVGLWFMFVALWVVQGLLITTAAPAPATQKEYTNRALVLAFTPVFLLTALAVIRAFTS